MIPEPAALDDSLRLIQAEYREMPGLNLTRQQVQRLWRLEPHAADAVLAALVSSHFLRKTSRGVYVLAIDACEPPSSD